MTSAESLSRCAAGSRPSNGECLMCGTSWRKRLINPDAQTRANFSMFRASLFNSMMV